MVKKISGIKFWYLCMRKNVEEKGSDMGWEERSLYGS
jgi:hypothetical protein